MKTIFKLSLFALTILLSANSFAAEEAAAPATTDAKATTEEAKKDEAAPAATDAKAEADKAEAAKTEEAK